MINNFFDWLRELFSSRSKAKTDLGWDENSYQNGSDDLEVDNLYKSDSNLRTKINIACYLLLAVVFGVVWFKLWSLQVVQGRYNSQLAEENRVRTKYTSAPRGLIYDKDKEVLASNRPGYALMVYPADLPEEKEKRDKIFKKLKKLTDIDKKNWKKIEDQYLYQLEPIILKENLREKESLILQEKTSDIKGVMVEDQIRRKYKQTASLGHLLGYIGKITENELDNLDYKDLTYSDYTGKSGLEKTYDKYLRGEKGKKQVEVDSVGRVKKVLAQVEPEVGNSLVLSLDFDLQKKAHRSLANMLKKRNLSKGVVVASDPQTGEILTMVSLPGYNNNIFAQADLSNQYQKLLKDENRPLFNRVISGLYPSGSVIKPVVAAAGLQENVVEENTWINCKGKILVENIYNPDIVYRFKDWKTHGPTNVTKALAESCNVFFYHLGGGFGKIKGLGYQKLADYFKKFGLGSKTGVDLPLEEDGLIPSPEWKKRVKDEVWYQGDTYHMSIGQGDLLTTPLQVNNYIASIANNGKLLRPHLTKKIIDGEGNLVKKIKPEVINKKMASKANLHIVKKGMRAAVTDGTATPLDSLPVAVAGKTGTAQTPQGEGKEHSWFTAFAPYNNPEIAITVMVENGGEGYESALPVTKDVLKYYFNQ